MSETLIARKSVLSAVRHGIFVDSRECFYDLAHLWATQYAAPLELNPLEGVVLQICRR
jgi:hypothetical protein